MSPISVRMVGLKARPGQPFEFDYIPRSGDSWQTCMRKLEEFRMSMGALSFSVRSRVH